MPCEPSRAAPGFFKAKDIAEAGFIYGLPIVMAYGVMYEFVVDKTSRQYKAPFNQIHNDAQVFTWRGHGRRHTQQRHALLDRAGSTCGPSRS